MVVLLIGKLSIITFMVLVMGFPFTYYYKREKKWRENPTREAWYR